MRESLRTKLVVVIVVSQVFVTLEQTCGIISAVVDCIAVIVAVVVRWADACLPPLTGRVLWIVIICL